MIRSIRQSLFFLLSGLLCAPTGLLNAQNTALQGSGSIAGRVFDAAYGMPLIGVNVTVVDSGLTASTDIGGNYRIVDVPAGTVSVSFQLEGYGGGEVSEVVVAAEAIARLDTSLQRAEEDFIVAEEFKVTASAMTATPMRQIMERKMASVPVETLDSSEFAKFAATDAADLLRLMSGVNIADGPSGKFAVVRGLSERYNPVMLDGIVLPSPDPERQTPQLDLFPSKLMDSLAIFKAASPELPSFSSGGAVDIRTRPFPEQRNGQFQFGLKFDEGVFNGATFNDYPTQGDMDLVALGKSDRAAGMPYVTQPNGALAHYMDPVTPLGFRSHDVPIGGRFSINFEDRLPLGQTDREFAYGFNLTYDSGYTTQARVDVESPGYIQPGDKVDLDPDYFDINDYAESTEEVSIGLLGVVGLKLGAEHTISLSAFVTQNGEDTVTDGASSSPDGNGVNFHTLHYKQRNLTNLRLGGEHVVGASIDGRLRWRVARITTTQDEPDYRFVPYTYNAGEGAAYGMIAGGPERRLTRYWRAVEENTWAYGTDYGFRVPQSFLPDLTVKVGLNGESTVRDFDEKYYYWAGGQFGFDDFIKELPRTMYDRRLGPVPGFIAEGMNESLSDVAANREVVAPFAGFSARLWGGDGLSHSLTLNAGVQFERYHMDVNGLNVWGQRSVGAFYQVNPFLVTETRWEPDGPFGYYRRYFNEQTIDSTLPSAGLVYSPGKNVFLRLNASKTTARPSFREAGPYYTVDQITLANVAGNIAIRPSSVRNLDFRAEYFFPKSLDLVAVSVFAKEIDEAIERVGLEGEFSPKLTDTWINNPETATVRGVEVEFRKNLAFVAGWLEAFSLGGNGAWIDAEVERFSYELKDPALFRSTRRLFDQPEWIANAYLTLAPRQSGFSATVSISSLSDVLRVANQVTVDEFAEGYTQVDLSVSQKIGRTWIARITAKNLSNPERRIILDREYVPRGDAGDFAFSRWSEGRSYSISLQRNF